MSRTFLVCPPDHYEVRYIINPWMRPDLWAAEKPRLSARAQDQWQRLIERLWGAGAQHVRIAPAASLPDMVFAANFAFVLDRKALVARYAVEQRMGESSLALQWFVQQGYEARLSTRVFEGGGDALYDAAHQMIWLGHGFRSVPEAQGEVAEFFALPVEPLELVDPRYYHLDTCLCPLPGGHALVHRDAFSAKSFEAIKWVYGDRLIEVGRQDAEAFACNAVPIGQAIVMSEVSEGLKDDLRKLGYDPRPTPLDCYILAGGSSRCLTLPIDDVRRKD